MSFRVFAAYSRRFLTSTLQGVLPHIVHRSVARSIRVLWHMRELGGGWLSMQDLRGMGAGQWKAMSYTIPDLLRDNLIDTAEFRRNNGRLYTRYKINADGLQILTIAERHVKDEYEKAVARCEAFKKANGISAENSRSAEK